MRLTRFDEGSAIQLLDGLKKRGVLRSADQDGITVWMRNIDGVQEEALADVAASQPVVQVEAFAETSETTDIAEILALIDAPMGHPSHEIASPHRGTRSRIFAVYKGVRTEAVFVHGTNEVTLTSGPLSGQGYQTPSGAARAVVAYQSPTINPLRNGWEFWNLDDGSGRQLRAYKG